MSRRKRRVPPGYIEKVIALYGLRVGIAPSTAQRAMEANRVLGKADTCQHLDGFDGDREIGDPEHGQ